MRSPLLNLDLSKEEALAQVFPQFPVLTSKTAGWDGIYLAYDYQLPGETPEVSGLQHGMAIFTEVSPPSKAERKLGEVFRSEIVKQGDIVIVPGGTTNQTQWYDSGGVIMLGFEPEIFNRAIYEMVEPETVEIAPHFATPDPLICQLGLTLKAELESNGLGSKLYAETIANLLIVHLLQHYSVKKPVIKNYTGGLPKYKLQQVLDYINAYLEKSLGLEELAQVAQMSPAYFSRLFKQSTGLAPHQYLIQCRVHRAKQLLIKGNAIADVAYKVGFANQAHLNYHFKRLLKVTPKALLQK